MAQSSSNRGKVTVFLCVAIFIGILKQYGVVQHESFGKNALIYVPMTKEGSIEPITARNDSNNDKGSTNINSHGTGKNRAVRIEDPRPWLVVHVGPPKTGTTTIQSGLLKMKIMKLMAVEDNIYYLGMKRQRGKKYILPNDVAINTFTIKDMIMSIKPAFGKEIRKHRTAGRNVILSSEHLTSNFPRVRRNIGLHFDNMFDLRRTKTKKEKQKQEQEQQRKLTKKQMNPAERGMMRSIDSEYFFGFRVKLVVAYRHFFQWLPSIHFQHYLSYNYERKPPSLVDFIEGYVTKNQSSDFLFDHYEGLSGSLASYKWWSSIPSFYDRIDVFDLHQQQFTSDTTTEKSSSDSLFANFVCQSLPSANKTCEFLIEDLDKDSEHNEVRRTSDKKGSTMMPVDRFRTMDEAIRRGIFDHPDDKTSRKINVERRKAINRRIDKWYFDSGGNQTLFPKRCPGETTLQKFREKSLDYLWEMASLVRQHSLSRQSKLGIVKGGINPKASHALDYNNYRNYDEDMFRSSTPRDNLLLSREYSLDDDFSEESSWWKAVQVQHDAEFDKYVAKEKFCEVDLMKLFENKEFVRLIFLEKNGEESNIDAEIDGESEATDGESEATDGESEETEGEAEATDGESETAKEIDTGDGVVRNQ